MSTKSFTINLPIITGDQDRRRLQKSFSFGCNLQNAVPSWVVDGIVF